MGGADYPEDQERAAREDITMIYYILIISMLLLLYIVIMTIISMLLLLYIVMMTIINMLIVTMTYYHYGCDLKTFLKALCGSESRNAMLTKWSPNCSGLVPSSSKSALRGSRARRSQ